MVEQTVHNIGFRNYISNPYLWFPNAYHRAYAPNMPKSIPLVSKSIHLVLKLENKQSSKLETLHFCTSSYIHGHTSDLEI